MNRKRQSRKSGGIGSILMTGAGVAGGLVIAGFIGKSSFAAANPILKVALPIGGAILLPMVMGKSTITTMLATGMAVAGVTGAVSHFAPGLAATVGLAGGPGIGGNSQWRSNYNPGVAGGSYPVSSVVL